VGAVADKRLVAVHVRDVEVADQANAAGAERLDDDFFGVERADSQGGASSAQRFQRRVEQPNSLEAAETFHE